MGVATAYGMTDQSWVSFADEVMCMSLMMVGSCETTRELGIVIVESKR
jgi:hypothetical protein